MSHPYEHDLEEGIKMQQEVDKDRFVVPVVGGVYVMQVNPTPVWK